MGCYSLPRGGYAKLPNEEKKRGPLVVHLIQSAKPRDKAFCWKKKQYNLEKEFWRKPETKKVFVLLCQQQSFSYWRGSIHFFSAEKRIIQTTVRTTKTSH